MEGLLKKLLYKRQAGLLPRNDCVTSLLDGMCMLTFTAAPTQPTTFTYHYLPDPWRHLSSQSLVYIIFKGTGLFIMHIQYSSALPTSNYLIPTLSAQARTHTHTHIDSIHTRCSIIAFILINGLLNYSVIFKFYQRILSPHFLAQRNTFLIVCFIGCDVRQAQKKFGDWRSLLVKRFIANKYRLSLVTIMRAYYKDIQGPKQVSWNTLRNEHIWEQEKSNMVLVTTELIGPLVAGLCWSLAFMVVTQLLSDCIYSSRWCQLTTLPSTVCHFCFSFCLLINSVYLYDQFIHLSCCHKSSSCGSFQLILPPKTN